MEVPEKTSEAIIEEIATVAGRGSHSSTFRLNLSTLNGIGDARRGCVARVKEVLGGV